MTERVGLLIAEASRAPPEVTARLLVPRHGVGFSGATDFGMLHREQTDAFSHAPIVHRRELALTCDSPVPVRVLWVRVVTPAHSASRDSVFALAREPHEPAVLAQGERIELTLTARLDPQTQPGFRTALVVAAVQIDHAVDLWSLTASSHTFLVAVRCVCVVGSRDDFSLLRSDAQPFWPEAVRRIWQAPATAVGCTAQPIEPLRAWYAAHVVAPHARRSAMLLAPWRGHDPWALPPEPRAGAAEPTSCWPDALDCTALVALSAAALGLPAEQRAGAQLALGAQWAAAYTRFAEGHAAHFARLLLLEEAQMRADYEKMDLHFAPLYRKRGPGGASHVGVGVVGSEEKRPALLYADKARIRLCRQPGGEAVEWVGWVSDASNPRDVRLCLPEPFNRAYEKARERGASSVQAHVRWVLDPLPVQAMSYALHAHAGQAAKGDAACRLATFRGAAPARRAAQGDARLGEGAPGPHAGAAAEDDVGGLVALNAALNAEQRAAVLALLQRGQPSLDAARRAARPEGAAEAGAPPPPPPPPPALPPPLPYVVWGPPGTGKTCVLVEQVLQILGQHADASEPHGTSARVLVCAPSNGAADVALARLVSWGGRPECEAATGWRPRGEGGESGGGWVHRLNSSRRSLASLSTPLHRHCAISDGAFCYLPPGQYAALPLLVSTCVAALDLVACGAVPTSREGVPCGHFTHILIDEATQGLEPELLIPLCLGRPPRLGGCVVALLGDHRQLGPVVRCAACRAERHGLDQSLLARLMNVYEADGAGAVEPACPLARVASLSGQVCMLVRNYRSHAGLLQVPSALFYQGRLTPAADPAESGGLLSWAELRREGGSFPAAPLLVYGLVGQQLHELDSPSFFNPTEGALLVHLAQALLADEGLQLSTDDLGVITPYRKQVLKLRRLLREKGLGAVRVGSVDDYQGQEERIILISTVISTTTSDGSAGGAQTDSLMASPQRFNVAITRAKALLVVVGNPHALAADPHWRALLRFALQHGTYRGVPFSLDEPHPDAADAAADEEEAEAMLSRLAQSALGGGYARRRESVGEQLDLSNDLEWRLMI